MFRMFKKYPDLDFDKYMGSGWQLSWINECEKRYPEVSQIDSFKKAKAVYEAQSR